MGVQYINRQKYGGRDATGENIKVTFKGEERQLNSVLNELGVYYVDALPATVEDKIYGLSHNVETTKNVNTFIDDIIGSYCHFDGTKYVVDDDTTLTHNGKTIEYLTAGDKSYTADNGDVFSTLNKYDFTVTTSINHTDYYVGDAKGNRFTQLADMEVINLDYINKEEKGTAGGVATLDANGMLPISQMPTESQIYIGEWDASTGTNPPTPARSGIYYNISVEGTIDGVHYNVNDWIIWDGTKWNKQVQTADVSSVDGRKGAVNLEDKYAQLGAANTFTGFNTFTTTTSFEGVVNMNMQDINNASYVHTNNIEPATDGGNLYIGDENGAIVSIGSNEDGYNNATNISGRTINFNTNNPINGIKNVEESLYTGGDFLDIINNLPAGKNRTYFLRMHGTFTNSPLVNGDVDFHVVVYKIDDSNYIRVMAYDVRTWYHIFTNAKVAGSWTGWVRLANMGDVPTNLSQLNNNIQAVTGSWDGNILRLYTH